MSVPAHLKPTKDASRTRPSLESGSATPWHFLVDIYLSRTGIRHIKRESEGLTNSGGALVFFLGN
jgi:hypothetical protein